MKVTRKLLLKGAPGFSINPEQKALLGIKECKHGVRNYIKEGHEISEETYQKYLALETDHEAAKRKAECRKLLDTEIKKYDSEHLSERKVVTWRFSPFTTYVYKLYSKNRCIKSVKWGLNVDKQLLIVYFGFANFTLCCTFKHTDDTVRIERIAESKSLVAIVPISEFQSTVIANFPKLKIVVKRK